MPKTSGTFVSYISDADGQLTDKSLHPSDVLKEKDFRQEPDLLPGEVITKQCPDVLEYAPFYDKKRVSSGILFVTNFRISYISVNQPPEKLQSKNRNKLVANDDIPLASVSTVYEVSKGRKKKISPTSSFSSSAPKTIQIHLKNFRVYMFSFKYAPKDSARQLFISLMHHSFPVRVDLLFAFDYDGVANSDVDSNTVPRFDSLDDWRAELKRLRVSESHFRALTNNQDYQLCDSLPQVTVVPASLPVEEVKLLRSSSEGYRWPVWTYSYENGAALLRCPTSLHENSKSEQLNSKLLESVQVNAQHESPYTLHVGALQSNQSFPTVKDFSTSYEKLKECIMTVKFQDILHSESKWFSQLESTHWLQHVSKCLSTAQDAAARLSSGQSVVIKEKSSRDFSALLSSLIQIHLDPYTWTIQGFQSLLQKEWVSLGHDFTTRLGFIKGSDEAPLFLLFLDCVWHLTQQFVTHFEFSEIYLTSLWDTACLGLYETFVFSSSRERDVAMARSSQMVIREDLRTSCKLMSAWSWSGQFTPHDQALFINPLHTARRQCSLKFTRTLPLKMNTSMCSLGFWSHNYLRWLTPVQIMGGGSPAEYLQLCHLVEEIVQLQHKVSQARERFGVNMRSKSSTLGSPRPRSDLLFGMVSLSGGSGRNSEPSSSSSDVSLGATAHWLKGQTVSSSYPFAPFGARAYNTASASSISLFLDSGVFDKLEESRSMEALDLLDDDLVTPDDDLATRDDDDDEEVNSQGSERTLKNEKSRQAFTTDSKHSEQLLNVQFTLT